MSYHTHIHKKAHSKQGHITSVIDGFTLILRMPLVNFFVIFMLTFALFLPVGFYIIWKNASALDHIWSQSSGISLYLKKNVSPTIAANIAEQLKLDNAVMDLKLISPDEGIEEFAKRTGFDDILLGVKENPLPYVIVVYTKLSQLTKEQIKSFIESTKTISDVDIVKVDMDWIERSCNLLNLWRYLSSLLTVLLSIGAFIVFCFTIYAVPRVIINKENVSVRVLQYQCFWYGLISSLFALAVVNFILVKLDGFGFVLQGLGTKHSVALILFAILLSVISSRLTVRSLSSPK